MGTNYYLKHETVPAELHIGKSSYGWAFSLHVIPEKGITSLVDWERLFDVPGWKIANEHGEQIEKEKMLDNINRVTGNRDPGIELCRHNPKSLAYQHCEKEMLPTIVDGKNYDLVPGDFR